jgi:2-phosphoglycerate kinase
MQPTKKIFIWGVPGSGKTTFSGALQNTLTIPLIEGDYLRKAVAQKEKSEVEDPFLYVGTTSAWRHFGEMSEENIIKGLNAVRTSMAPYVRAEVQKYSENLIFEAAFLMPDEYKSFGKLILICTEDEEQHKQQYFEHRELSDTNLSEFTAARILQNYFITEARSLGVQIITNNGDTEQMVKDLKS